MKDYISREALENWVREELASLDSKEDREFVIQRWRKEIPAADVRPVVHARWVYNPGDNIPYCSECMMPQDSECNFCPICGADMTEE